MNKILKAGRLMDQLISVVSIGIAAYWTWLDWPSPTFWTWVAIVSAIISVPLAVFDWMTPLMGKLTGRFIHKRG